MIVSACEALSRAICAFRSVSESSYVWTAVIRDESRPEAGPQPREHVLAVLASPRGGRRCATSAVSA